MFLCYIEKVVHLSPNNVFLVVFYAFLTGQLPGRGQVLEVVPEGCPVMNLNTLIQTLPVIAGWQQQSLPMLVKILSAFLLLLL